MAIKVQNNIKMEEEGNKEPITSYPFLIKREKEQLTYKKGGDWSMQENTKYIVFLESNASAMEGKPHSQLWSLYKEMSEFLKSRNYRQCKNYHQKQCLKHKTIPDIMSYFFHALPEIKFAFEKEKQNYQEIKEKSLKNNFGSLEVEKEEKNELMPTDIGYHQEERVFDKKPQAKMFTENSVLFPMMANGVESKMEQKTGKQYPQAQDWIQCHFLFMRYVNKLNEIQRKEWSM